MKNNKTAGLEIPAELLKYGGLSTIGRNTDEWHEQLLERKVCPRWLEKRSNHKAAKESDISDCNNWRGITLLSVPSSLLTNNIKPTSRCSRCNITRGAGWLPPRSIMHRTNFYIAQHYWTVREIPAATVNKLRRLQESIRQRAQTITVEYCQTVRNLTESVNNMLTFSWIEFQLLCENRHWSHWIFQHHYWCTPRTYTAPFLFLLIINRLCHAAGHGTSHGIKWTSQSRLTDLEFDDDISLVAETRGTLHDMTTNLEMEVENVGLRISANKTKNNAGRRSRSSATNHCWRAERWWCGLFYLRWQYSGVRWRCRSRRQL